MIKVLWFGIFVIACSAIGYRGGRWLWQKFASSSVFSQIRPYIKGFSIFAIVTMASLFIVLASLIFDADIIKQKNGIENFSPVLWFFIGYMIGYDVVLIVCFRPPKLAAHEEHCDKFKVYWRLIWLSFAFIYILVSFNLGLDLHSRTFQHFVRFSTCALAGGCLGAVIWYHLRQVSSFSSEVFNKLVISSIITTGYLIAIGIWIMALWDQPQGGECEHFLVGAIYLFLEGFLACMIFYFVALLQTSSEIRSTFRSPRIP